MAAPDKTAHKRYMAVVANKLLLGRYSLEETEYKLIRALLGKVEPFLAEKGTLCKGQDGQSLDCSQMYYLSVTEYAHLFGMETSNARNVLAIAANNLFESFITLREDSGSSKQKVIKLRWVQKIVFDSTNDSVGVMWTNDVSKHISQLGSSFTQLRLEDISKLSGSHTLRLYELLVCRFNERGKKAKVMFTLEELYFMMDISTSFREYAEFKRRILLPSLARINGIRDIAVEEGKRGRKVVNLTFVFGKLKVAL